MFGEKKISMLGGKQKIKPSEADQFIAVMLRDHGAHLASFAGFDLLQNHKSSLKPDVLCRVKQFFGVVTAQYATETFISGKELNRAALNAIDHPDVEAAIMRLARKCLIEDGKQELADMLGVILVNI